MNPLHLLTLFGTGVLTILPQVFTALPPPWNIVASGIIATGGSVWHLYQPAPGGK